MPPRFDLGSAVQAATERGWPLVMGIVNVTPDSFSDGGCYLGARQAVEHALRLVEEGADLLDIGGESTRPGAARVDAAAEVARVEPVIAGARQHSQIPISVDTSKAAVMRAAAAGGADLINDVRALRDEGSLAAAVETALPVVLMHMQGEPRTMQLRPTYADVVGEVCAFLADRAARCEAAGIPRPDIVLDPGFGFGKTLAHNLTLLKNLRRLADLGYPVLVGLSRKSMIEKMVGRSVEERVPAGVALALAAASRGASIIRTHDVAATVDALRVWGRVEAGA